MTSLSCMIGLLGALTAYDDALLFSGDFYGFIVSIYTPILGQFFGGLVLLTMFAIIQIRTGEIAFGAILWLLVGASFEIMIPTAGFSVAKLFMVLGIASILFSLFTRSRRSSSY